MPNLVRGTTPKIRFTHEYDAEQFAAVQITFTQGKREVMTFTQNSDNVEIDENAITVSLGQAETLGLSGGSVEVQVRVRFNDETAWASKIWAIPVDRILKDGEI